VLSSLIPEELEKIKGMLGANYKNGRYAEGANMFEKLTLDDEFVEFLTLPAYEEIVKNGA